MLALDAVTQTASITASASLDVQAQLKELVAALVLVVVTGVMGVVTAFARQQIARLKESFAEATKKVAEGERVRDSLIVGYESAKTLVPKAIGDAMDEKVQRATTAAGVERAVAPVVRFLTKTLKAVDDKGDAVLPPVGASSAAIPIPKFSEEKSS